MSARKTLLWAVMSLLALSAQAQDSVLDAQSFDRLTRGKTFVFGLEGKITGAERYFPGRKVIWSFGDGTCQEGEWFESQGLICFTYLTHLDRQCWMFRKGPEGLSATFMPSGGALDDLGDTYSMEQSDTELSCEGPNVGV